MIKNIILLIVVVFFSMNMGASGIAPSFAAAYGGRLIRKVQALLLFSACVTLGAVTLGKNVTLTMGKGLLPQQIITFDVALIILASATLGLFLANALKIPQSTSQVTVGAIVGAGLYFGNMNYATLFLKVIPLWIVLPLSSYILTFLLYRIVYPPLHDNLHLYQKIFANEKKLRMASLIASCYVAFAIGANNAANAVGPLFGAGIVQMIPGLLLVAPLFGIGAWVMGKGTMETAGCEIVPLGMVSSTLVAFVTATVLIIASLGGVPQSLVQLNILSILAVGCLKNGHRHTLDRHVTRKTFAVWTLSPLLAVCISYLLLLVFSIRR
ncbi:MAG: inorganic phosphate transporter [bacterium]